MKIHAYQTKKIVQGDEVFDILDSTLPLLKEKEIVVVTSKIVAICQGDVVKNDGSVKKIDLIKKEADLYIDEPKVTRYNVNLTIKRDILIANAGIDESNGNGYFILWPRDSQKAAEKIWEHLRQKHHLRYLGIIISESRTTPLRWGTLGVGLAWCGFEALKNYIGEPDIFGRSLKMTKLSVLDGLAAGAVTVMGEGNEQTPLAVISDVPFAIFQDRLPTKDEREGMRISRQDDIYSPLTNSPKWKKGGNGI